MYLFKVCRLYSRKAILVSCFHLSIYFSSFIFSFRSQFELTEEVYPFTIQFLHPCISFRYVVRFQEKVFRLVALIYKYGLTVTFSVLEHCSS